MKDKFRLLNLMNPGDFRLFKNLHNELFKGMDVSSEWIVWFFDSSMKRIYSAFDDDKLIGIWCVEPKKLVIDSGRSSIRPGEGVDTIAVGRCFAVGIHPDFRRRNLFTDLSTFALECERQFGDYEYILGFPQRGRPVIGAHLRAGWEIVQNIELMTNIPLKNSHGQWSKPVSLYTLNKLGGQLLDFTGYRNNVQHEVPGSFYETDDYLNQRWLQHPNNAYITLCIGDHSYVVLKPYKDMCHVMDVHGSSNGVLTLLQAVQTLAYRHQWREVTSWCASNDRFINEFIESGFMNDIELGRSIQMLAVRINATEPLKLSTVAFRMGSEESY